MHEAKALECGAHLTTRRLGYRHHGLYAGGGRVLHYRGMHRWAGHRRGPVEEITLEQFANGRGFEIVAHAAVRYDGAASADRARSRLGEDRWRLWSNNCEHFVTWCLDGVPRSAQVEAWRARWQRVQETVRRVVKPAQACSVEAN
jgi:Lecithin retinol acyltransferase